MWAGIIAELLVLRHENAVLRRQVSRVRYEPADRLWLAALSRLILWVPKTCATCADASSGRRRLGSVSGTWLAGPGLAGRVIIVGLRLIFLIITRAVSLLGLSRRESWWKNAEILMLRHQLAVAEREHPRAHSRLTWPDRAWLALLAGTLPTRRLAVMRLIVTPGTIVRWHRGIVRRRWARRSRQRRSGRPPTSSLSRAFGSRSGRSSAVGWVVEA